MIFSNNNYNMINEYQKYMIHNYEKDYRNLEKFHKNELNKFKNDLITTSYLKYIHENDINKLKQLHLTKLDNFLKNIYIVIDNDYDYDTIRHNMFDILNKSMH
jgi:hypothetical protein